MGLIRKVNTLLLHQRHVANCNCVSIDLGNDPTAFDDVCVFDREKFYLTKVPHNCLGKWVVRFLFNACQIRLHRLVII